mmetsp:Transcript_19278/g.29570  ORF Transcript_19278/g.29570 Transcript_19278/m.29570 type:complete len:110 (+) Transcript_19278:378-707(+)|eukprot:CAMPEP_0170508848 /NCGR_PEP_ID=MMETSP0208-20121228/63637_1 /TAXON_ID=197538 /ORGANISM="Strombidium inclinatum, Strain S3" /LENGTH=109 /DNA_ID=CAMNT_0010791981 /DNA_START=369 /DNA_END=698 /DNA_ORIENTATION=+
MAEIVQGFCLETFPQGENVVNYGDQGDCCYIILKGVVSVQIPNTKIKDWKLKYHAASVDNEWKEDIDHRFEVAKLRLRDISPQEDNYLLNSSLRDKLNKYDVNAISEDS